MTQAGINMGMEVIAEGVEAAEQLAYLKSVVCLFGWDYLFSIPLSEAEFLALVEASGSVSG